VFCVGNSLTHAGDRAARRDALAQMASTLRRDGRLVLTSRSWELVRQQSSRPVTTDQMLESRAEHLTFWPFKHADLLEDLEHVGLQVCPDDLCTYALAPVSAGR
jgi:hypothetical protein